MTNDFSICLLLNGLLCVTFTNASYKSHKKQNWLYFYLNMCISIFEMSFTIEKAILSIQLEVIIINIFMWKFHLIAHSVVFFLLSFDFSIDSFIFCNIFRAHNIIHSEKQNKKKKFFLIFFPCREKSGKNFLNNTFLFKAYTIRNQLELACWHCILPSNFRRTLI